MHVYINKQLINVQNLFYLGLASVRVIRYFIISKISTGNITVCQGQHVACMLQVELAGTSHILTHASTDSKII